MLLSRNKKNNIYPCKPQFYHIKVGFKGSKLYRYVFAIHINDTYETADAQTKKNSNSRTAFERSVGNVVRGWTSFTRMKPHSYLLMQLKLKTAYISRFLGQTSLFRLTRLHYWPSLRKHAYSNILKILPLKNENFQIKNSDIFHVSAQNIDCWYLLEPPHRGGSNKYPQYVLSRNKKNNVYPCKPQFYYIKVGFNVVEII